MPEINTTTCTIPVTDQVRELFALMNFQTIPEDADYICFLDDGNATFLSKEQLDSPSFGGFMDPNAKFIMFRYSTTPVVIQF